MTRISLTLHDAVSEAMRNAAAASKEIAGVLIVGTIETDDEVRLLGREFHPAPTGAYREQSPKGMQLSPEAYLPALARAATLGASALFVHSHPEDGPTMSDLDDRVDEQLRSVFQIRTGSRLYGALVVRLVGQSITYSGRLWRDDTSLGSISLLREVGRRFRFTRAADAPAPGPPSTIFDRQVLAFGAAMQELLGHLHIGIVGCGGTGSSVAEQLIRLGVGTLTVIDEQALTDTNVTRVYGSGSADAGMGKVAIVQRNARRIGLSTEVRTVEGSVTRAEVARALVGCDLVFGCTDDHAGRLVLARIAYMLIIPVIDLGVRIYGNEGVLSEIACRLNVQVPGTACGQCWGVIDLERARAELMSTADLRAAQRDGYAPDLETPDPAVVAYTTLVAALGVAELLARLTGLTTDSPDRVMFLASSRQVSSAARLPAPGHWCGNPETWGIGDTKRFLDQTWPE